ncbi:MAG: Lon protease-like protein [Paraglaciecola sp.]|jgi:Lon protease-like protein
MDPKFTLSLFPLSAHILPGGKMSLRIFELRYIRMIKEACAASKGFGVCMLNSQGNKQLNQHIFSIGTYVEVVDFEVLAGGLLGVTVAGDKCFRISDIETEPDELRVGTCEWLPAWVFQGVAADIKPLDDRLREVFDYYPDLKSLYQRPFFTDPIWVIYRWLELLPVDVEEKQQFLQQKDYFKALEFLTQFIK